MNITFKTLDKVKNIRRIIREVILWEKKCKKGGWKMGELLDHFKMMVEAAKGLEPAELEELKKSLSTVEGKAVQFSVEGVEECYLEIKEGVPVVGEGKHTSPAFTIIMPPDIAKKVLITRELNAIRAFLAKQYKIEGSLANAMKFGKVMADIAKLAPKA